MPITFDAGGKGGGESPLLQGVSDKASRQSTHGGKGGQTHAEYAEEVMHICSLLHALALQHLRDDDDLDNLLPVSASDVRAVGEWSSTDAHSHTTPGIGRNDLMMGHVLSMSSTHGAGGAGCRRRISLTPNGGGASLEPPSKAVAEAHSAPDCQFIVRRLRHCASAFLRLRPSFHGEHIRAANATLPLRVLGGLRPEEREVLELDVRGRALPTDTRVAMVGGWFMRRLIARQKFEQGESRNTSPPILSRLYQVISDGTLNYAAAAKLALVPFPFPYQNLLAIFLVLFTIYVPVLVNGILMNVGLRAAVSFVAVFSYNALAAVGNNLEDPFSPYDRNELPLHELQDSFIWRLLSFGTVPEMQYSTDLNGDDDDD